MKKAQIINSFQSSFPSQQDDDHITCLRSLKTILDDYPEDISPQQLRTIERAYFIKLDELSWNMENLNRLRQEGNTGRILRASAAVVNDAKASFVSMMSRLSPANRNPQPTIPPLAPQNISQQSRRQPPHVVTSTIPHQTQQNPASSDEIEDRNVINEFVGSVKDDFVFKKNEINLNISRRNREYGYACNSSEWPDLAIYIMETTNLDLKEICTSMNRKLSGFDSITARDALNLLAPKSARLTK